MLTDQDCASPAPVVAPNREDALSAEPPVDPTGASCGLSCPDGLAAYDVMGSKHLGADVNLAWPSAQIAVMGAQGAVNILYRNELVNAADPEAKRAELITKYEDTLVNPYVATERGYIDAVISPHETRIEIVRALRLLKSNREILPAKKDGNIPL